MPERRPYIAGNFQVWMNVATSASMVGASYASTIAIFWPDPVLRIASKPYACRICVGEYPVGPKLARGTTEPLEVTVVSSL